MASTTLATFRIQVDALIKADDDELASTTREALIEAALERYSRDNPDSSTKDVTGDGGNYYAVSGLTGWSEGFSRVLTIEYPAAAVASDEMPVYLESDDWQDDYWAAISGTLTRHIYLPNHAPAATETMRITYTLPYTFSSSPAAVDVPAAHFYALCHLAAGLCCQAIAAKYSRTSDSTIAADSVNHTTRAGEYSRRAKEFMALYEQHLGLDDTPDVKAAGAFADWDTGPTWPAGRSFMFHGPGVR